MSICNYDLHTHSTASDGTMSPSALVQTAAQSGIEVLALTDHDTLSGIKEAKAVADEIGINLVPGVEISVTWNNKTIHIVGLHVNYESQILQDNLNKLRETRLWRAQEIGRKFAKHGIADAFEGAKALSNGNLISRTHFARFLVQQGFATGEKQVFKHFLVPGKPGYVQLEWAKLEDAVQWIVEAGGQAVLAHPGRYSFKRQDLRHLIHKFQNAGGCALEVISSSHTLEHQINIVKLAKEFNLLSSIGSDFHDAKKTWLKFGTLPRLPEDCVPIWKDWNYVKYTLK
ncbi:phosphoesterase [Achromatium sp. WMS3]|nr:phosphoesterase [Achromatium sp. WMS3]